MEDGWMNRKMERWENMEREIGWMDGWINGKIKKVMKRRIS